MATYQQLKEHYICTQSGGNNRSKRPLNAMVGVFCGKKALSGERLDGKVRIRITFYNKVDRDLLFKHHFLSDPNYIPKLAFSIYRNRLYLIPDSSKGYSVKPVNSKEKDSSIVRFCMKNDPLLPWVSKNEGYYALSFDSECGFYYISTSEKL